MSDQKQVLVNLADEYSRSDAPVASFTSFLTTALKQANVEVIPAAYLPGSAQPKLTAKKWVAIVDDDALSSNPVLAPVVEVANEENEHALPMPSGGTWDHLGFSFPFGTPQSVLVPAKWRTSKELVHKMHSKKPKVQAHWDNMLNTFNFCDPRHCLFLAYALLFTTRSPMLGLKGSAKDWKTAALVPVPANTARRNRDNYIALFVGALLYNTTPRLRVADPELAPNFLFDTCKNFKIEWKIMARFGLFREATGENAKQFPPVQYVQPIGEEEGRTRWAALCHDWELKKFRKAFSLVFSQPEAKKMVEGCNLLGKLHLRYLVLHRN